MPEIERCVEPYEANIFADFDAFLIRMRAPRSLPFVGHGRLLRVHDFKSAPAILDAPFIDDLERALIVSPNTFVYAQYFGGRVPVRAAFANRRKMWVQPANADQAPNFVDYDDGFFEDDPNAIHSVDRDDFLCKFGLGDGAAPGAADAEMEGDGGSTLFFTAIDATVRVFGTDAHYAVQSDSSVLPAVAKHVLVELHSALERNEGVPEATM